jgi:hypothetical protein
MPDLGEKARMPRAMHETEWHPFKSSSLDGLRLRFQPYGLEAASERRGADCKCLISYSQPERVEKSRYHLPP